jgi:hypothetical protein
MPSDQPEYPQQATKLSARDRAQLIVVAYACLGTA